jgi:type VI secretion system secreted protein VgrG
LQHLPRVGIEVAVSFMNGDPDAPVVVGCFYHQEMQPVFPIPSQQTKSGFRSRSTLHGGTQDYNELSFDDRKGQEVALLHAQKDHKIEVEHDQNATIGHDRTVVTERNDSLTSKTGDISIEATAGNVTVTAAESIKLTVGGSSITITPGSITLTAAQITIGPATTVVIGPIAAAMEIGPIGAALNIGPVTADVNIVAAGEFSVEAASVTLATAEFIAPLQGT